MRIVASQAFVDIWTAIDEDEYDGAEDANSPVGTGIGRDAAINDLVERMVERAYEDGLKDGQKAAKVAA